MAKAEIHNRALRAAEKRADELVDKLARLIEPIIAGAGREASRRLSAVATDHLTAAARSRADRDALGRFTDAGGVAAQLGRSLALCAAGDGVTPTSTMIAIMPRPAEAQTLADGAGTPPENVHVTLAYLGKTTGDLSDVASALTHVAAGHAPLAGKVGGVGHFADNGNGHPAILLPSVPGLVELRVAVTDALVKAGVDYGREYGYLPHATLDYSDDPIVPDPDLLGSDLHFDSLWVVRGNTERIEMPLTGVKPLTAAGTGEPNWTPPAVDEVFDMDAFVAQIRAKTDPVRNAVVKTVMKPTLDGVGISFDTTNPFTANALSKAGQHVTSIADTTRSDIQNVIDASYQAGLSIPNTAKAIKSTMKSSATTRALMIARTELVGAVNGGSLAAAQIVSGATDTQYSKVWLTAPGAKYPRHDEYDGLDGQEVGLDEAFDVGGSQLQFPGDPDGDPGEVINCRCTMIYDDGTGQVGPTVDAESGDTPPGSEGDAGAAGEADVVDEQGADSLDVGQIEGAPDAESSASSDELAGTLSTNASAAEPLVTTDMQAIVGAQGGTMAGLEHRLKTTESLSRKITTDARERQITVEVAASRINDSLRYTGVFDSTGYTAGVKSTLSDLEAKGYKVDVIKNYWKKDTSYNGINAILVSPSGTRFELQFHTPQSLALKQDVLHPLYETYRVSTDAQQRLTIWNQMVDATNTLKHPSRVASIGTKIVDTGAPKEALAHAGTLSAESLTFGNTALEALDTGGGFSLTMTAKAPVTRRYVSALSTEHEVILESGQTTKEALARYLIDKQTVVGAHPNAFLGGWKNAADGRTYLDVSTSFSSLDEALRYAGAHDQIAIWDMKDSREITVPNEYRQKRGTTAAAAPAPTTFRDLSAAQQAERMRAMYATAVYEGDDDAALAATS